MPYPARQDVPPTPLAATLAVTALLSLGTGVFWNAIAFIAKHGYDFSQTRTLVMYIVMGSVYVVGAFSAGRLTRRCARWMRPRTVLALVVAAQAAFCLLPILSRSEAALWIAVVGGSVAMSFVWPIVESYLTAGRHGAEMRSTIGWFNVVWMSFVAVPLFLMPPILEHHARWAVGAQTVANLLAFIPLLWFAPSPGHHDRAVAGAHVPAEYASLLAAARVMLPLSYVLMAALSPILPYRFEAIGADVTLETPTTAIWMVVRVAAAGVMWRLGFWHGRWGALVVAGLAMTGGFGIVVLAPTLPIMIVGFAVYGVGMGATYYAALYYAMAVGLAEVDAGGTHEGLIGSGYTVGPAAALAGAALGGPAAIVGIVWGLIGVGSVAAVRPYLRARRRRRAEATSGPG